MLIASLQMHFKFVARLPQRRLYCRHLAQRVEQPIVMNHSVVAHRGYCHARRIQLAGIRLTFIPKHIELSRLHQGRWQALQLFGGRRSGEA